MEVSSQIARQRVTASFEEGAGRHNKSYHLQTRSQLHTTQTTQARVGALMSPSSCLDGASHGWVPVNTHSTPVPGTPGRLWVAHQQQQDMSPVRDRAHKAHRVKRYFDVFHFSFLSFYSFFHILHYILHFFPFFNYSNFFFIFHFLYFSFFYVFHFFVFCGHPQTFVRNDRDDLSTRGLKKIQHRQTHTHTHGSRSVASRTIWCLLVMTEERVAALESPLDVAERALTAAGETIQAQRLAIDRLLQAQPQGNILVDTRSLGKPPPFSGDLDAQGKPVDGMHWSQWSFAFRAYAGAFDPDARGLLEQAGQRADNDGVITNQTTSEAHSQLSAQLFHMLTMTCHVRALAVVQRVQEGCGCSRCGGSYAANSSLAFQLASRACCRQCFSHRSQWTWSRSTSGSRI